MSKKNRKSNDVQPLDANTNSAAPDLEEILAEYEAYEKSEEEEVTAEFDVEAIETSYAVKSDSQVRMAAVEPPKPIVFNVNDKPKEPMYTEEAADEPAPASSFSAEESQNAYIIKGKKSKKKKLIPILVGAGIVCFICLMVGITSSMQSVPTSGSTSTPVVSTQDKPTGSNLVTGGDGTGDGSGTGGSADSSGLTDGSASDGSSSASDTAGGASGSDANGGETVEDTVTGGSESSSGSNLVTGGSNGGTGSSGGNTGASSSNGSSSGNTGTSSSNGSSSGNTGTSSNNGSSSGNAGTTGTTAMESTTAGTTANNNAQESADGYTVAYSAGNSWESSGATFYGMEIQLKNASKSAVSGWTLVLEIDGLSSVDGWSGTFTVSGNKLTVTDAGYNGEIASGGVVSFGCNLGVKSALNIKSATLNGVACTIKAGTVASNNNNSSSSGSSGSSGNDNNYSGTASADKEELLARCDEAVQGDDWLYTDGNSIYDKNGKEVWITGVNWFGYNTGTNTFDGLWNSELVSSIEAIADHGFNLIRVPMSAELINQWASGVYPKANYNNAYNPDLNNMNSLEIFDYFLKVAEENGLKVMPDIHSAETNASGHTVNLWYTDSVSVSQYYAALEWMAARYKNNDTIIAYDLKNEPHGKPYEGDGAAIWNNSTDANNWKYVAQTAALKVLAKNPNVLIMVEGIEIYPKDIKTNGDFSSTNDKDYYFNWWGGNLRGVADYPINLGKYQNKLVYSPHDYGPTVYEQPWFEGSYDYNSLMDDCWYDNWFYIYDENIAPLLIGEWGGFMKEPNLKWMTCMRTLIKKYHLHHTFWCYNANSGDTGGLVLDDFKTWDEEKYAFVKEVLWQENGKFVGLDHAIPLGDNGITLSKAKGL